MPRVNWAQQHGSNLMIVIHYNNLWYINHGGRFLVQCFFSEADAWSWADENIDDQVFGGPNRLSPPLDYRETSPIQDELPREV